jgi:hypothetical protein
MGGGLHALRRALLVGTLALVLGACSYRPSIDPLRVVCELGKIDDCPEGHVCGADPNPARPGWGHCCRDSDGDGNCDLSPPEPPPGIDGSTDARADGGRDAPDAPSDTPVSPDGLPDVPIDAPADARPDTPAATPPDGCAPPCQLDATTCTPNLCSDLQSQESWQCGPGGVLLHCAVQNGCGYEREVIFCDPSRCEGTPPNARCACPAPPMECEGKSGTFCQRSDLLDTCGRDANGCLTVTSRTSCPAGKSCIGALPTASCSCPGAPVAACPGVGRSCVGNDLTTCTLDANGCVTVSRQMTCRLGRTCAGDFAHADCTCGQNTECRARQTVGASIPFSGSATHPAQVLVAVPIDVLDGAFIPFAVTAFVSAPGMPDMPADRQVVFALYSSDAAGEPDRLLGTALTANAARQGTVGGEIAFKPVPLKQPSGRYWVAFAFNEPTPVGHDEGGPQVPIRSVKYPVDWMSYTKPPNPWKSGEALSSSTMTMPNYALTIDPQ